MSYVMRHSEGKLKRLLDSVPEGCLVDTPWLASRGIDRKLAHYYVSNGWLESVTSGVYCRGRSPIHWEQVVFSLQSIMGYEVHPGGKTALGLAGLTHYVEMSGDAPIHLYGDTPSWLKRLPYERPFKVRSRRLFRVEDIGLTVPKSEDLRLLDPRSDLQVSTPERAILELLDLLPKQESFHNADMIFENLSGLRPSLLETLLGECRSIKVKRLFFVFAQRHAASWLRYLDLDHFNLGKGPRSIMAGGRMHPAFNITVPKDFALMGSQD
jgi:hypothetical protein